MARKRRKTPSKRRQGAKPNRNTPSVSANVVSACTPIATQLADNGSSLEKPVRRELPESQQTVTWNFWLAAIVAVAAVVQAVVATFQWDAMNKQNAVMIDQNEIIRRQIDQSDETLAQMKLQTPQSLVRVKEATIEPYDGPVPEGVDRPFFLSATLENVGELPATITGYMVSPIEQEFVPNSEHYKELMEGSKSLFSKTQVVLTTGDTWVGKSMYSPGDSVEPQNPTKGLREFTVIVYVQYSDAVKENRRSRFLYKYSPTTGKLHAGLDGNYVE